MSKFRTDQQVITIQRIPRGRIVDICGGGEGVIARIGRERVTAVDRLHSEIDEAKPFAPEATWVLADVRQIPFSDTSFDNATCFFGGMCMSNEVKVAAFKEVHRILRPNGEFWCWDASMPVKEDFFVIRLLVDLPCGKQVTTRYGNPRKEQSPEQVIGIMKAAGFSDVKIMERHEYWHFLIAR